MISSRLPFTAPVRWQPSAQYLNQCRRNLSRPPRKLLVLDVEGTLCCLRRLQELTHKRRRRTSRVSIARPFLGPFLSYIFHPDTRNWLDVMAWSSRTRDIALPTVQYCFAHHHDKLLTAFYKDPSLPLDVRVKNLESAWLQLRSRPEMRADDSDHFGLQPSSTTIPHAAYSTIFVDNNPENARFQPHNFVQLPKYSIEVRLRDVKHFLAESSIAARNRQIEAKFGPSEDSPKNWGFRQDDSKREERARPVASSPKSSPPPSERTYDNALLALVGVLDELKLTFNVGAWIRGGGLYGVKFPANAEPFFKEPLDLVNPPDFTPWWQDQLDSRVTRGIQALRQLGIKPIPGVTPPVHGDEEEEAKASERVASVAQRVSFQ